MSWEIFLTYVIFVRIFYAADRMGVKGNQEINQDGFVNPTIQLSHSSSFISNLLNSIHS